jgi:hypothetical protein
MMLVQNLCVSTLKKKNIAAIAGMQISNSSVATLFDESPRKFLRQSGFPGYGGVDLTRGSQS